MPKMYGDYVKRLSTEFETAISRIEVGYNFDYGDEFEIAICKVLRLVLPDRYGICRGYVVSADGRMAGDDVIIYDPFHLPFLRPLESDQYAQKQKVPVEAVYAYIEAKHGLILEGSSNSSLDKAIKQVAQVKEVLNTREQVSLNTINRFMHLPGNIPVPDGYPSIRNPAYAIIFARHVRARQNEEPLLDPQAIMKAIKEADLEIQRNTTPDLIVLGKSCLLHPAGKVGKRDVCRSPFYGFGGDQLLPRETSGLAFGIAVVILMAALEYLEIGRINWGELVTDAFKPETTSGN